MTIRTLALCTTVAIALGSVSFVAPSLAQTSNCSTGEQAQTRELNLQQLQQGGGAQLTQNNGNGTSSEMPSQSSYPVDNSSTAPPDSNSLNANGTQTNSGSMSSQPGNQANPNCTSTQNGAAQNCPAQNSNNPDTAPHN